MVTELKKTEIDGVSGGWRWESPRISFGVFEIVGILGGVFIAGGVIGAAIDHFFGHGDTTIVNGDGNDLSKKTKTKINTSV